MDAIRSVSYIFYDPLLNSAVNIAAFLQYSRLRVTFGAGTLQANKKCQYQLIDLNRVQVSSPNAGINVLFGFDMRTTGNVTTARVTILTVNWQNSNIVLKFHIFASILLHEQREFLT